MEQNMPQWMSDLLERKNLKKANSKYSSIFNIYKGDNHEKNGTKYLASLFFAFPKDSNDLIILSLDGIELAQVPYPKVAEYVHTTHNYAKNWSKNVYKSLQVARYTEHENLQGKEFKKARETGNYYFDEAKRYMNLFFETLLNPVIQAVAKDPTLAEHISDEIFNYYPKLSEKIIKERDNLKQKPASYNKGKKLLEILRKIEDEERE